MSRICGVGPRITHLSSKQNMKHQHTKDQVSFGQRLANEANRARELAYSLPAGKKRDALLEKARLADLGARINGWLVGPELAPVKSGSLRPRSD